MKKLTISLFALLMAVTITGCAQSTTSDTHSSIPVIEAYIDQLMQTQEMKESIEFCKANNMDHELEARKDTLVYKYTYTVPVAANTKDLLNTQYNSLKDALAPIAELIKSEAPAVKTVIWEYYSMGGDLITSFSF